MDNQQMLMHEADEGLPGRSLLRLRRFLVLGLYLSFFVCLITFWSTGLLFGGPGGALPTWLMGIVETNHLIILIVPLVSLALCYIALRFVTGDSIVTGSDRYLDERQKLLRSQAHGYAYKIIKFVCLLVLLGFLLHSLPWATHFLTPPQPAAQVSTAPSKMVQYYFDRSPVKQPVQIVDIAPNMTRMGQLKSVNMLVSGLLFVPVPSPSPTPWFDGLPGIVFYSALLLCLFLLITALPLSILAWKKEV